MHPSASAWLPVALLATPLVCAGLVAVTARRAQAAVSLGSAAVTLALALAQAAAVVRDGPILALGGELLVDGLAALLAALIAVLVLACTLFGLAYLPGSAGRDPARRAVTARRLTLFRALFCVLQVTLLWVVMTNNIVLLWVALEATTLASALLVSFFGDARALEAGYKYLLLLTVGITAALFGCVLLYAAAAPHLGSQSALLISNLRAVAGVMPAHMVLIATLLLLVGFGTKAGLAPFHPWVADAHAEAPAVMSALLSSVIIKVPFVAILRVWSIVGPRFPVLNETLLVLGAFTLVVGGALALVQDDLKRLHAYSSVSQVGFIALGLGTGSYLGYYGAVFFLVAHALAKGLLFLTTGAVSYAARDVRSIDALGGLVRRMPVTAACCLAGALSLAGMPPLAGFAAKLTVLAAVMRAGAWPVAAVGLLMSLATLAYMMRVVQRVFLGDLRATDFTLAEVREVPLPMTAAMVVLALAVVALGAWPPALDPLMDLAARR